MKRVLLPVLWVTFSASGWAAAQPPARDAGSKVAVRGNAEKASLPPKSDLLAKSRKGRSRDSGSKGPAGPSVTFSGFQAQKDGRSRFYAQLTEPSTVEENVQGKRVDYVLRGVHVPVHNNENPLIVRHFQTVVVSIRLLPDVPEKPEKKKGKKGRKAREAEATGVRVVVELREAVRPQQRVVRNADGSATFVVDFPKPRAPVPPEPDPTPPPARVESSGTPQAE